jgi:hypothetical protein
MDAIFSRIRQITEELYVVRDDLNKRAARDERGFPEALVEDEAADALIAFKAAVDEIRQFLWQYLNDVVSHSGIAVGDRLREYQMRRAAQLLLALSSAFAYKTEPHPLRAAARDVIGMAELNAGGQPRPAQTLGSD